MRRSVRIPLFFKRGFSLIEALVVAGVLAVVMYFVSGSIFQAKKGSKQLQFLIQSQGLLLSQVLEISRGAQAWPLMMNANHKVHYVLCFDLRGRALDFANGRVLFYFVPHHQARVDEPASLCVDQTTSKPSSESLAFYQVHIEPDFTKVGHYTVRVWSLFEKKWIAQQVVSASY